jgi:hypothetical protein
MLFTNLYCKASLRALALSFKYSRLSTYVSLQVVRVAGCLVRGLRCPLASFSLIAIVSTSFRIAVIVRAGFHSPSFIAVMAPVIHFFIVIVLQNVAARLNKVDHLIRHGVPTFGQCVMYPHSGAYSVFSSISW